MYLMPFLISSSTQYLIIELMREKSVAWRASEGVVGRESQIILSVRETSGKVIREVVSKVSWDCTFPSTV